MAAIIESFKMTKGDIDDYPVTIKNSAGVLEDLTGASIVCTMKLDGGATLKIDRRSSGITIANQTNNKGEFDCRLGAADTDVPGTYNIEFEVTLSGGKKITFPKPGQGKAQVIIEDSLDTV